MMVSILVPFQTPQKKLDVGTVMPLSELDGPVPAEYWREIGFIEPLEASPEPEPVDVLPLPVEGFDDDQQ